MISYKIFSTLCMTPSSPFHRIDRQQPIAYRVWRRYGWSCTQPEAVRHGLPDLRRRLRANLQVKQIVNMMACGPMVFFLEHFSIELFRDSAEYLYKKLIERSISLEVDCTRRLLLMICELAPSFVGHFVISDAGNDDTDSQQNATLNEHFVEHRCSCYALICRHSWSSCAAFVCRTLSFCLRSAAHHMQSTICVWIWWKKSRL